MAFFLSSMLHFVMFIMVLFYFPKTDSTVQLPFHALVIPWFAFTVNTRANRYGRVVVVWASFSFILLFFLFCLGIWFWYIKKSVLGSGYMINVWYDKVCTIVSIVYRICWCRLDFNTVLEEKLIGYNDLNL